MKVNRFSIKLQYTVFGKENIIIVLNNSLSKAYLFRHVQHDFEMFEEMLFCCCGMQRHKNLSFPRGIGRNIVNLFPLNPHRLAGLFVNLFLKLR